MVFLQDPPNLVLPMGHPLPLSLSPATLLLVVLFPSIFPALAPSPGSWVSGEIGPKEDNLRLAIGALSEKSGLLCLMSHWFFAWLSSALSGVFSNTLFKSPCALSWGWKGSLSAADLHHSQVTIDWGGWQSTDKCSCSPAASHCFSHQWMGSGSEAPGKSLCPAAVALPALGTAFHASTPQMWTLQHFLSMALPKFTCVWSFFTPPFFHHFLLLAFLTKTEGKLRPVFIYL